MDVVPVGKSKYALGDSHGVDDAEQMTFDDLTKAYREENRSPRLSELRHDFHPALRDLLQRITEDYEMEFQREPFSILAQGLNDQRAKILRYAQMTIDLRLKKIVIMALMKAMGGAADKERFLPEERDFFTASLEITEGQRQALMLRSSPRLTAATPAEERSNDAPGSEAQPLDIEPIPDAPGSIDEPESVPMVIETLIEETEPAPEPVMEVPDLPERSADYIIVRVLEEIPPFAGPERNYRLRKEDVVTLPHVIGQALVAKGMAQEIRPH